jgi:hypothetical protein
MKHETYVSVQKQCLGILSFVMKTAISTSYRISKPQAPDHPSKVASYTLLNGRGFAWLI